MHKQSLVIILLFTSVSFTAWSDSVALKNGDNLSGKIKLVDGSKVLIETEYAGTITIDN